jgi:hypothetical protein
MVDTDVMTEPDLGGEPIRFPARRVVRWMAVLTIGILVVLAIWQEPLYAGG